MPLAIGLSLGTPDFRAGPRFHNLGTRDPLATTDHGWLGAWEFTASPSPNTILSSPGASATSSPPGTISGGAFNTNDGGMVTASATSPSTGGGTKVSIAFTATTTTLEKAVVSFQVGSASNDLAVSSTTPAVTPDSASAIDFGVGGIVVITPFILVGLHHYTVVADYTAGTCKIYVDGVLNQTVNAIGPCGTFSSGTGLLRIQALSYAGGPFTSATIDNVAVYFGILSSTAIASLAAGRMPAADGVLV